MTITVPDELREEIQEIARAAGFDNIDSYATSMLTMRPLQFNLDPPEDMIVRSPADLEEKLRQGLESGERDGWFEFTPEMRRNIRNEVFRTISGS